MQYCGVARMNRAVMIGSASFMFLCVVACSPTVKIEAPEKPIVINLNVKIEHEIRVKVDKDLESVFANDELF